MKANFGILVSRKVVEEIDDLSRDWGMDLLASATEKGVSRVDIDR